jgi:hypothetical protein
MPETRALFPCGRPSYPKENPATGEHDGVCDPCTPGVSEFGATGATLPGGPVFRGALRQHGRIDLFSYPIGTADPHNYA